MRDSDRADDDWSMSERREKAVMKDMPNIGHPPAFPEADDFKVPTARGILSKEEIQALLRPDLPTINRMNDVDGFERDFTRQDRSAEVSEGRRLAARLSRAFGQHSGLKAALTLRASSPFSSLSDKSLTRLDGKGTAYMTYGKHDGDVTHVLCLGSDLNDHLISNACGATIFDDVDAADRPLSAIDCALIEQFLAPFASVFGDDLSFLSIETDRSYVLSLLASDEGTSFEFDVKAGQRPCAAALWTLRPSVQPVKQGVVTDTPRQRPMTAVLTARVASLSVPVSRVSKLKAGDTLLFGLPADQPVELLSGGRDGAVAFEGDIGRKGDRMAVRISRCV
jgi:hypothetical protein